MRPPTTRNRAAWTSTVQSSAAVRQKRSPKTPRGTPTPQNPRAIGRYSFFTFTPAGYFSKKESRNGKKEGAVPWWDCPSRRSSRRRLFFARDGVDRDSAVGDDLLGRTAQEEPGQAADARRHDDELEALGLGVIDDAVPAAHGL